ncbi:MAG: hypothetical protein AAGA53_08230 [Pseudomonadota bacterium]
MAEGYFYSVTTGETRFEKREIVRISPNFQESSKPQGKRIFVPFAGYDGQSLAGSGALVFEGELLELRN